MPTQPNIIFIHVDEMRFPMHFPPGIQTAGDFLAKFMPNLYSLLWAKGVKFSRYFTAAADCTPGRGTFVTGLYAYQTGLFLTRESTSNPYATSAPQPPLQKDFLTYGKLLRNVKPPYTPYETPYVGKWHLSDCPDSPTPEALATYLQDYGFQGLTIPDPLGMPSQGIGLAKPQYQGGPSPIGDPEIAAQAVKWLYARSKDTNNTKPFCLTVGFVNPHDKQFFWGGTQANQFNAVYYLTPDSKSLTGFEIPAMGFSQLIGSPLPPSIYAAKPNNWESAQHLQDTKPKLQTVFKNMFSYFWTGQISEDQNDQKFYAVNSAYAPPKHDAVAPYSYWWRALDYYTQMMSAVDGHIGEVLHNIPANLVDNTVIVFSADHGEYASSHGLQGKGGTVYNECFNVPLIVYDPRPAPITITKETGVVREQLVSSVDLLRMLVTIGHNGNQDWLLESPYRQLWGDNLRADLYGILQSNNLALGRQYVVYSTDEFFKLSPVDHDNAPQHVVGCYTDPASGQPWGKIGFYHHWKPGTTTFDVNKTPQWEYYLYNSEAGKNEVTQSPIPQSAKDFLLQTAMTQQMNKALPSPYNSYQSTAITQYWQYVESADFPHVSTAFA